MFDLLSVLLPQDQDFVLQLQSIVFLWKPFILITLFIIILHSLDILITVVNHILPTLLPMISFVGVAINAQFVSKPSLKRET
jgi:hypothetical protein